MKKIFIAAFAAAMMLAACSRDNAAPPAPFGPVPTAQQMDWQKMEYYMFIHFGPNTFTNVEWGDGKEDPDVFYPTDFDADQWAQTAMAAGMTGIILTAKHHDGFCLWPSAYSTHTVRESKWRNGEGDVVREVADACRRHGLKFGVYLSPWDQNHPTYGTPEYNEVFAATLREVLTNYGDIFEMWFDGANGEGPNGRLQEYDWDLFHSTVRECQPDAVIFSDVGPDVRWIGNERGFAGTTNWSRLNIGGFEPGLGAPPVDTLNRGNIHGAHWIPGEVDVSIRPGWFYSPQTDARVKSLAQLFDIWHTSVGRNATLLLNVPPDRRGRIHENDSVRLMELRALVDETFSRDLAAGAVLKADNTRGRHFAAANMLSADYDAYWATGDGVHRASFEVTLPEPRTFNRLQLQEYIPLGQRVMSWDAEYYDAVTGEWLSLSEATTIGYKRIVAFDDVTTDRLRVNITASLAPPVLNGFALFRAPDMR
ncbi:MAG: alpha-L-fucosidase [Rikenellaceae bacterium]|nr:alpha-L-fucosidase [Rikenellaceae bacterium]MCL2692862.1 alpha-L-fucosidase [Rikenellaceae bacterium]